MRLPFLASIAFLYAISASAAPIDDAIAKLRADQAQIGADIDALAKIATLPLPPPPKPVVILPAEAVAVGATTPLFFDGFLVDSAFGSATDRKWFPTDIGGFGLGIQKSNWTVSSADGATLTGSGSLSTVGDGSDKSRAWKVGNGLYIAYRVAVKAGAANENLNANNAWPAVWEWSVEQDGFTSPAHSAEPDGMEWIFAAPCLVSTLHDWQRPNPSGASNDNNIQNSNNTTCTLPPGTTSWADGGFHTYAQLFKPVAKNGGTGSLTWFYDGVPYQTVTWTAGAKFSVTEAVHLYPIFSAAPASPLRLQYVGVWGAGNN